MHGGGGGGQVGGGGGGGGGSGGGGGGGGVSSAGSAHHPSGSSRGARWRSTVVCAFGVLAALSIFINFDIITNQSSEAAPSGSGTAGGGGKAAHKVGRSTGQRPSQTDGGDGEGAEGEQVSWDDTPLWNRAGGAGVGGIGGGGRGEGGGGGGGSGEGAEPGTSDGRPEEHGSSSRSSRSSSNSGGGGGSISTSDENPEGGEGEDQQLSDSSDSSDTSVLSGRRLGADGKSDADTDSATAEGASSTSASDAAAVAASSAVVAAGTSDPATATAAAATAAEAAAAAAVTSEPGLGVPARMQRLKVTPVPDDQDPYVEELIELPPDNSFLHAGGRGVALDSQALASVTSSDFQGRQTDAAVEGSKSTAAAGKTRVAVCLVGGARDFELSGPSILTRVLTAYPHVHVFVHSPLDEATFKLWMLRWAAQNVTLAAVRVFPNWWVDEEDYPRRILVDVTSPQGNQGMFQYLRLVEGCIPLIRSYERRHGFTFDWVLRTRVDTFWARGPPPLLAYRADAYTIPHGTDCLGLNDRLGVGTWNTTRHALARLSLLPRIAQRKFIELNSERSFRAQLIVTQTPVTRRHFFFCVISRRRYAHDMMPVASLASTAPLNGAKCRPCTPWLTGKKASRRLWRYRPQARLGPVSHGVDLCNAREPWQKGWEVIYDRVAGPLLASYRKEVMMAGQTQCTASFAALKARTEVWDAPSTRALCLRRSLGPTTRLGLKGGSFDTLLRPLSSSSVVLATRPRRKPRFRRWEEQLEDAVKGIKITNVRKGMDVPARIDVVKVDNIGVGAQLLSEWVRDDNMPRICQLLVAFNPQPEAQVEGKGREGDGGEMDQGAQRGSYAERDAMTSSLARFDFQLNSCIRESKKVAERCTYFSLVNCD